MFPKKGTLIKLKQGSHNTLSGSIIGKSMIVLNVRFKRPSKIFIFNFFQIKRNRMLKNINIFGDEIEYLSKKDRK